jgi:hypothetical protein
VFSHCTTSHRKYVTPTFSPLFFFYRCHYYSFSLFSFLFLCGAPFIYLFLFTLFVSISFSSFRYFFFRYSVSSLISYLLPLSSLFILLLFLSLSLSYSLSISFSLSSPKADFLVLEDDSGRLALGGKIILDLAPSAVTGIYRVFCTLIILFNFRVFSFVVSLIPVLVSSVFPSSFLCIFSSPLTFQLFLIFPFPSLLFSLLPADSFLTYSSFLFPSALSQASQWR